MNKPYASTTTLYAMMATPGENKKIREYIDRLEKRVYDLENELSKCNDKVEDLEVEIEMTPL